MNLLLSTCLSKAAKIFKTFHGVICMAFSESIACLLQFFKKFKHNIFLSPNQQLLYCNFTTSNDVSCNCSLEVKQSNLVPH